VKIRQVLHGRERVYRTLQGDVKLPSNISRPSVRFATIPPDRVGVGLRILYSGGAVADTFHGERDQ
jgi:hypothetical protein